MTTKAATEALEVPPDFAQLATRELLTDGDRQDAEGAAARHRARTWAMLALAQSERKP